MSTSVVTRNETFSQLKDQLYSLCNEIIVGVEKVKNEDQRNKNMVSLVNNFESMLTCVERYNIATLNTANNN